MSASLAGIISFPGPTVLGRFVEVRLLPSGSRCDATIMDLVAGENLPKRIRIQTKGELQGKVLLPGEYEIIRFL